MDDQQRIFSNLPTLTTPRLMLRKMSLDDAEDLFSYASDPEVTFFTSWEPHQSVDDSRAFLQQVVDAYAAGEVRSWAVVHRDDERMIGTAGFLFWDHVADRAEIGYALSRDYWGTGLMTEAVKRVVRFGFEEMRLNRIEARVDALNLPSARVLQKCGFQHEGTLREQYVRYGQRHDMMYLSILRREWRPED